MLKTRNGRHQNVSYPLVHVHAFCPVLVRLTFGVLIRFMSVRGRELTTTGPAMDEKDDNRMPNGQETYKTFELRMLNNAVENRNNCPHFVNVR